MTDSSEPDRARVAAHVADIMFDANVSPDPECLLCKQGVDLGIWGYYGVDDPFAPEDSGPR